MTLFVDFCAMFFCFIVHIVSFSQEKSGIEVFWRPLSKNASALLFFSRRTDMPYRYTTSLSKLNYTAGSYKVCVYRLRRDVYRVSTWFTRGERGNFGKQG